MLRFLFCISCCSPPPNNRAKRRTSSQQQLKSAERNSKQDLRERKTSQDLKNSTVNLSEKDQSLIYQIDTTNGDYKAKSDASKGKIILPLSERQVDYDGQMTKGGDSLIAPTSIKLKRADAFDDSPPGTTDFERHKELGAELKSHDSGSVSPTSSVEVGTFAEKINSAFNRAQLLQAAEADEQERASFRQQVTETGYSGIEEGASPGEAGQPYETFTASTARNVPSTTKIGDYARIEYSPIDDLDSETTMSYSRFGSEKGGSRSQAGSTLSRQNSLKANNYDESVSRKSSHCGIESTSMSIASQLSNEQFQQNLTNMLESVNTNYSTIGTIGLPLGPPLESTMTETTKTSPETPGAALTSASQDSLSDVAIDDLSPMSSRPGTLRSNKSVGAALIGSDSIDRADGPEDMAELAQPAPLVSGEDDDIQQSYPSVGSPISGSERVDTPQSITTTTSGGITNPTPTPSEMSGGSGKKKRSKAKSLFKKLKPGTKKNKGDAK